MSSTATAPTTMAPDTATHRRPSLLAILLVAQVLALAFILASFPVRNADFWLHLAVGRSAAQGEYQFGEDPLAYTTSDVYWANHSWLFDLLLYHTYAAAGDGVVLLKAVFVAVAAGVVLLCCRPGERVVLPALVTGLALFAMASRLLLHSALISVGLLAVTTLILLRPPRPRAAFVLPLVMALWVNLDGWFVLGPLAVFLAWLGERWGTPPPERRIPTWVLISAVGACVLSPHHVRAFALPPEVSPAVLTTSLPDDPRFQRFFEPAWNWRRYTDPVEGLNAGGIAYLALLTAGLISFALVPPSARRTRLPLWVGFTLLGLWNVRLVPFFAVVVGPVMALNLQDFLAVRPARSGRPTRRPLWVRLFGLTAAALPGILLLVLAWAGWLQSPRSDARKVGWAVQPDPGLRHAAEVRAAWRRDGRLTPDDRAFHTHPDSAAYAAWFAPGERCFLDQRLNLFTHVADDYRAVCQAVGVAGEVTGAFPGPAEGPLRAWDVTYLVLHDPDRARLETGFFRLDDPMAGTALLLVSGREATFGWSDTPRHGGRPFAAWALDLDTAGFRPADSESRLPPPAPAEGPRQQPRPRTGWGQFAAAWEYPLRPPPLRPAEADIAGLYLRAFNNDVRHAAEAARERGPAVALAAVLAVGAPAVGGAGALAARGVAGTALAGPLVPEATTPSPSAALLAVRSARTAVAVDPADPIAYFRLGQAYIALSYATREYEWAQSLRPLAQLRHVQTVFALERAVALDPALLEAHALLAQVYSDRGLIDVALAHLREQERIAHARQRASGRTGVSDGLKELTDRVATLEFAVQERRNEYHIRAPGLARDPIGRARTALRLGLAAVALDEVLLASDVIQFGMEGARLELELLLMLGRTARLRQELGSDELREQWARLGTIELPGTRGADRPPVYTLPAYEWVRLLAAAGGGDYAEAQAFLAEIDGRLAQKVVAQTITSARAAAGLTTAAVGLAAQPENWPLAVQPTLQRNIVLGYREANRIDLQVRADLKALAGLLALEAGAVGSAREHFRAALRLADDPDVQGAGFAAQPLCRNYLWRIESAGTR